MSSSLRKSTAVGEVGESRSVGGGVVGRFGDGGLFVDSLGSCCSAIFDKRVEFSSEFCVFWGEIVFDGGGIGER